jgi:IS30 family transposase
METTGYRQLSAIERERISVGLASGMPLNEIARQLNRSGSTISREVKRHGGSARYVAVLAQRQAEGCAAVPRRTQRLRDRRICRYVIEGLNHRWSPEQIAVRMRQDYPFDMTMRISHETIYAGIYLIPRGELKKSFLSALRHDKIRRLGRPRKHDARQRGRLIDMTPIAERPAEVADRMVPGHWEGDLIRGRANGSSVGTCVERSSRLLILVKMDGYDATRARESFVRKLSRIPAPLRKSLTYDQGHEMAQHKKLAKSLSLKVYFADPHSPWQRGSNENTNGLLRQYLPKGTDLSVYSQRQLNQIAEEMNNRPRKVLDWLTPNEAWASYSPFF